MAENSSENSQKSLVQGTQIFLGFVINGTFGIDAMWDDPHALIKGYVQTEWN